MQACDCTIVVTSELTWRKLDTIRFAPSHSKQLGESAAEDETAQSMSVTGSLRWIARSCRSGFSYGVNKLQSAAPSLVVSDTILRRKLMKHIQVKTQHLDSP